MKSHHFTLIVDSPDLESDAVLDALFEAGCDDALVGRSDGVQYLDFDRKAESTVTAILSAIADVESVPGVEVIRLAGDGLVSMADIAVRTGRTRESVRLLVVNERGPGRFPAPVTDHRTRHRFWRWSEVRGWFDANYGAQVQGEDRGYDEVVATINAGLELRRWCRRVTPQQRARLNQLIGLVPG